MKAAVSLLSVLLLASIDSIFSIDDECVSYQQLLNIVQPLKDRIQELESHEQRISSVEKILHARSVSGRAINGEGVAFNAMLSGSVHHIGLNQAIRFNNATLNEGNGYNVHTGVFTAPTDGVYLFSYFLGHAGSGQMWLELMVNGKKINAGVADGFDQYEDDQGGNVAVVRLAATDTVWVESWHQNDSDLDGNFGFTTFSGVMIF